jgi:hypothetical protein
LGNDTRQLYGRHNFQKTIRACRPSPVSKRGSGAGAAGRCHKTLAHELMPAECFRWNGLVILKKIDPEVAAKVGVK